MAEGASVPGKLRSARRLVARLRPTFRTVPGSNSPGAGEEADDGLLHAARVVGADWTHGPYYDEAESAMEEQWRDTIWPFIREADFSTVVEVAAGHGRNSERLRHLAERIYLVDINVENTEFLAKRFADADNVTVVLNNGIDLSDIPDSSVTFVYSFDSMVHFDSDVVRAYLREFRRVLRPGGTGFCHYSNCMTNPTGSYRDHPGWRNFMSRELFEHYAAKEGLEPLKSALLNADANGGDAMTLFHRRYDPPFAQSSAADDSGT